MEIEILLILTKSQRENPSHVLPCLGGANGNLCVGGRRRRTAVGFVRHGLEYNVLLFTSRFEWSFVGSRRVIFSWLISAD